MSIVQSGPDIGLSNISSDVNRSADATSPSGNAQSNAGVDSNSETSEKKITIEQDHSEKVDKHESLRPEQLEKVAQELQDFVGEMNRGLEFLVDKDSGRDVIKVIDKNSGDLVKQFPSEEVLTLVAKLSEMVGGFVDAKV